MLKLVLLAALLVASGCATSAVSTPFSELYDKLPDVSLIEVSGYPELISNSYGLSRTDGDQDGDCLPLLLTVGQREGLRRLEGKKF